MREGGEGEPGRRNEQGPKGGKGSKFLRRYAHEGVKGEKRNQAGERCGVEDEFGLDHVELRCLFSLLGPHTGYGDVSRCSAESSGLTGQL